MLIGRDGNDTIGFEPAVLNPDGTIKVPAVLEDGNDSIFGDAGDDTLRGGTGDDTVRGGDGSDQVFGDEGADWLYGDVGTDSLYTEVLIDGVNPYLVTGMPDVVLFGGSEVDRVYLQGCFVTDNDGLLQTNIVAARSRQALKLLGHKTNAHNSDWNFGVDDTYFISSGTE